MNRSQRRAAAISWMITAAVLCPGAGLPGAAPVAADPGAAQEDGAHPGAVRQQSRAGRSGGGEQPPSCHWVWPAPPPPPLSGPRNNSIIVAPSTARVASVPAVSGVQTRDRVATELGWLGAAAEPAPPSSSEEAPAVAPALSPGSVAGSASPAVAPGVAALPLSGAAGGASAVSPPIPRRPDLADAPAVSARTGYPDYLRTADDSKVAALALAGLLGLVGITALGGFLGHRQATAGYLLRSAGIARFLQ